LYNVVFLHDLGSAEFENSEHFNELLKTDISFFCTAEETLGHDLISMPTAYEQRCKDFLSALNGTTADDSTTAMLCVAQKLMKYAQITHP
jgi:hypothetical protein